jgi:hypothetical protein
VDIRPDPDHCLVPGRTAFKCGFPLIGGRSRTAQGLRNSGLHLRTSAKLAAILLLPIALAACAGSDDSKMISFTADRGVSDQPYPNNYRAELLAFMKTYLNNPVGVHDAAMAEPVQRTVGGRLRYISCLRFTPRESDGSYREVRERAILYVNGRLDRVVENASDVCAGAVYAPYPDLEKLTR